MSDIVRFLLCLREQKMKINMIGEGFQHDVCSSALNRNKYVEWVKGDHTADTSIYIDYAILGQVNESKVNYGWLCESTSIIPTVVRAVCSNIELYKNKFKFIFSHDRRIIDNDPEFFKFAPSPAMPWIQNKQIYPKTKLISMIASNKRMCNGHLFRQEIISKFHKQVDHFGRGFGNRELPWSIKMDYGEESGKILALKDYMFSIAMENDNYDDIFVEKITDCFACGTIPIFWGTKNIGNYFDEKGIIMLENLKNLNQITPELYYSKMEHIKNNFEALKNLYSSEDYIFLNYLKGNK
jgi:hypothetical protein